jgi:diguanylate cyclase (GGDEF)-like protein
VSEISEWADGELGEGVGSGNGQGGTKRFVQPDQASADVDQTAADFDQTQSDADQSASDSDDTAAARDQHASDADRRASTRDQAASDRDLAAHATATLQREHDASRAERDQGNFERDESTLARVRTAGERNETATKRDEIAALRDLAAAVRDKAAAARDRAEEVAEQRLLDEGEGVHAESAARRARAAADRERAAGDREAAARDRELAASDREAARVALDHAELDDLTGVFRRSIGAVALQHEIDRARRSDRPLVLAFVDVDGLKRINSAQGHAAGDAVLRAVTAALRGRLRSYDPIVRYGGDEFVCALSDTDMDQAKERFGEISRELAETRAGSSISVGLAAMRRDESLEGLMARGDEALRAAKPTA